MARGWGNAPPDLKGTLGTLLRTTLVQLGSLRDVAVRELRSGGREWAERAPSLLRSRRTEVLASLGEIIYELARSGELDLEDFPELKSAVDELQEIDSDFGSGFTSPAQSAVDADPGEPSTVWRPDPNDYAIDGTLKRGEETTDRTAPPSRPARRSGQGHIAFVGDDTSDDEDLSEYMHEDDVPER